MRHPQSASTLMVISATGDGVGNGLVLGARTIATALGVGGAAVLVLVNAATCQVGVIAAVEAAQGSEGGAAFWDV